MRNLAVAAAALVGIGAGAVGVGMVLETPATAQSGGSILQCPDRLLAGTESLNCGCSAEAAASGNVWGSEVFTDDSNICRSAVHAGAIGANGGVVTVREYRGLPRYAGSVRNGVSSSDWGTWRRSITFEGGGAIDETAVAECPANATSFVNSGVSTCGCSQAAVQGGTVWGSGPYTADSNICAAARHAGVLGIGGGVVRFQVTAGRASYPASTRNGIATNRWASYDHSLVFVR